MKQETYLQPAKNIYMQPHKDFHNNSISSLGERKIIVLVDSISTTPIKYVFFFSYKAL